MRINGTATVNYTFLLESDDGSQMYLDSKLVVSDPGTRCSHAGCHIRQPSLHHRRHLLDPKITAIEEPTQAVRGLTPSASS